MELSVRLAWISSHITPWHASYLLASKKAMGSEVGEDIIGEISATQEAADAVRSVVFDSSGWRTIRCWWAAERGGEDSKLGSSWSKKEERSSKSCRLAEGSTKKPVFTAVDERELAIEYVLAVVTDLERYNSEEGELVHA